MCDKVKRIFRAVLVGAIIFGLTGCSIFSKFQGQSAEHATEQLLSVEGLDGDVKIFSAMDGFTKRVHGTVNVSVQKGYTVTDPEAFTNWLVSLAWSMNDTKINTSVALYVSYEEDPKSRDWGGVNVLEQEGYNSADGKDLESSFRVSVHASDVDTHLGGWPGKVPKIPKGMLTRVSE